jgi:hypothetical protein
MSLQYKLPYQNTQSRTLKPPTSYVCSSLLKQNVKSSYTAFQLVNDLGG